MTTRSDPTTPPPHPSRSPSPPRFSRPIAPGPGSAQRFLTDDTLLRILRARDSDEIAALKMLRATLEWRETHIDDPLFVRNVRGHPRCQSCYRDPRSHCFYEIGMDRRGRHVIYSNAARAGNKVVLDNMQVCVYCARLDVRPARPPSPHPKPLQHMASELERIFDGNRVEGKLVW